MAENEPSAELDPSAVPDPRRLIATLADRTKLRVFAALTLADPQTPTSAELAVSTGLPARDVTKALAGLAAAGLAAGPSHWQATPDTFRSSLDEFNRRREQRLAATFHTAEPEKVAVLLTVFEDDGTLNRLPELKNPDRLMIVLEELAQSFEPGVRYAEAEVNLTLSRFHPDYAALRRYLVDMGLLTRAEGFYWRSGGAVQV